MFKNSQGYTIVYFNTDAFQTLAMVVAEFTSDLELHGMLNLAPQAPPVKDIFHHTVSLRTLTTTTMY